MEWPALYQFDHDHRHSVRQPMIEDNIRQGKARQLLKAYINGFIRVHLMVIDFSTTTFVWLGIIMERLFWLLTMHDISTYHS